MTPWPCHRCAAPGVRNLCSEGWCAQHLAALYATFDPAVFALHGVGLPVGTDGHQLRCVACGATWWGLAGEACTWCFNAWQRLHIEHQAELALQPPETDPDDITLRPAPGGPGWTGCGSPCPPQLVDEPTARRTIEREVRRGAVRTTRPDNPNQPFRLLLCCRRTATVPATRQTG